MKIKDVITVLISIPITLAMFSIAVYSYKYHPSIEQITEQQKVDSIKYQEQIEIQESRRKTMVLAEEIEKQCKKINDEILDKNTMSTGEYIGLKLIGF